MRFRQHIPAFVSGAEPVEAEVADTGALLDLAVVKLWSDMPLFRRFSMSDNRLMAEYYLGQFWVVGFVDPIPGELPKWTREMCACGKPLHYTDPEIEMAVRVLVEAIGETANVSLTGGGPSWRVPRHYIALHGLKGADLAALAEQQGWKKAGRDRN